jgi:hypothetical protein
MHGRQVTHTCIPVHVGGPTPRSRHNPTPPKKGLVQLPAGQKGLVRALLTILSAAVRGEQASGERNAQASKNGNRDVPGVKALGVWQAACLGLNFLERQGRTDGPVLALEDDLRTTAGVGIEHQRG